MIERWLKDFHEKFGHYASDTPNNKVPVEVLELRLRLIKEEVVDELCLWLEMAIAHRKRGDIIDPNTMLEVFDGILDSVYVLVGTAVSMGLPFEQGLLEVHRSNMTKTAVKTDGLGQKYGTNTPKGPGFRPPELLKLL